MRAIFVLNAQNDFVEAYPEGEAIAENIGDYIQELANSNTEVFCIQDTHYEIQREYKFPYPFIGTYGHETTPEVGVALYNTRKIYEEIHYVMKTKPCAVEAIDLIKHSNIEEVIIMGFDKEHLLLTARAIKNAFPRIRVSFASRGITFDLPIGKLIDEGWGLIK